MRPHNSKHYRCIRTWFWKPAIFSSLQCLKYLDAESDVVVNHLVVELEATTFYNLCNLEYQWIFLDEYYQSTPRQKTHPLFEWMTQKPSSKNGNVSQKPSFDCLKKHLKEVLTYSCRPLPWLFHGVKNSLRCFFRQSGDYKMDGFSIFTWRIWGHPLKKWMGFLSWSGLVVLIQEYSLILCR